MRSRPRSTVLRAYRGRLARGICSWTGAIIIFRVPAGPRADGSSIVPRRKLYALASRSPAAVTATSRSCAGRWRRTAWPCPPPRDLRAPTADSYRIRPPDSWSIATGPPSYRGHRGTRAGTLIRGASLIVSVPAATTRSTVAASDPSASAGPTSPVPSVPLRLAHGSEQGSPPPISPRPSSAVFAGLSRDELFPFSPGGIACGSERVPVILARPSRQGLRTRGARSKPYANQAPSDVEEPALTVQFLPRGPGSRCSTGSGPTIILVGAYKQGRGSSRARAHTRRAWRNQQISFAKAWDRSGARRRSA